MPQVLGIVRIVGKDGCVRHARVPLHQQLVPFGLCIHPTVPNMVIEAVCEAYSQAHSQFLKEGTLPPRELAEYDVEVAFNRRTE